MVLIALVGLALLVALLTFWYWRSTKPVPTSLEGLDVMSSRKWLRGRPDKRARLLAEYHARHGAVPVEDIARTNPPSVKVGAAVAAPAVVAAAAGGDAAERSIWAPAPPVPPVSPPVGTPAQGSPAEAVDPDDQPLVVTPAPVADGSSELASLVADDGSDAPPIVMVPVASANGSSDGPANGTANAANGPVNGAADVAPAAGRSTNGAGDHPADEGAADAAFTVVARRPRDSGPPPSTPS
jgi:hypothetical protein